MIFLIQNWKTIAGMIFTAIFAYMLHSIDVNGIEERHEAELQTQAKTLADQCKKEKAITEDVSNDYQKKLSELNSRFNALRRVQSNQCLTVSTPKPAPGYHAAATAGVVSGSYGVNSFTLFELARDAEQVRLQLLGCQDFVNKEQSLAKGQD